MLLGGRLVSKLDWSRASERTPDPARYQRSDDFFTPDQTVKRKKRKIAKPPSPEQLRKKAIEEARQKVLQEKRRQEKALAKAIERERQQKKAAAKAQRRALAKQQQMSAAERKRLKEVERKARAAERRAAFEVYAKTPEYAAKLARESAKMAEKKKTHLQVWVENETDLQSDRASMQQKWRKSLLKKTKTVE